MGGLKGGMLGGRFVRWVGWWQFWQGWCSPWIKLCGIFMGETGKKVWWVSTKLGIHKHPCRFSMKSHEKIGFTSFNIIND